MINAILYRMLGIIFFASAFQIGYSQQINVKGKVSNATEALPVATISLNSKITLSDSKGGFAFTVNPGRYILTVTYTGYKKIEREIIINGDSVEYYFDLVLQPSDEMENFVVLGSKAMKQRSNLNTPVPIDLIPVSKLPARQIELTKVITNSIPSFNAAAHGFGGGKHLVPASLRGLGPDQTLVLLNGRRLHYMAFPWTFGVTGFGTVGTDMNAIPSASIETIEVLRDGASAQYGSDAIAGIIDLQLKKTTGITSINFHAGQYYKGDGEAISLSINHGVAFLKRGYLNLTVQMKFNNYTQRNGVYDSTVYYNYPSNASQAQKDIIQLLDNMKVAESGFDRKDHRPVGDNRVWNTGFVINGGVPLSSKTNLFWTTVWNYRLVKDKSSNVYRYPKESARVNAQLFPDGFLPWMESKIPDLSVIGGVDGQTNSGWYWDAAISLGKNSSKVYVTNSNNASQYLLGGNAPTSFYTGKQSFSQITNNINFRREISKNRNVINIALGSEFRIDKYGIKEGEEASWKNYSPGSGRMSGSQGMAGFAPENVIDKDRQIIGIYGEVEMEKNERLIMSIATRYEYYSDYGSNLAGKLAFRYRFSKYLLWRGSISNGFRAPSLQQRFYSVITTASRPGGALFRTGTFRNDSPIAEAFGISPLDAEKAINISTGFTSSVSKNISITIDVYWIQIKNRIIYSGTIPDSPAVRRILDNNGLKDVQNVRFFSNAINTRTTGLDIVIAGRWFISRSTLETSLAANFNKTTLYGSVLYAKNLPDDSLYRSMLVNREEKCRVENAFPNSKIILNLIYTSGRWKMNANFIRYGEVLQKANDPVANPDERFSPKIISSFNLGYKLSFWLSITAGAENIADIYPDKLKYRGNTLAGLVPYNPNFAPFGVNGGYYFMNISFNLIHRK